LLISWVPFDRKTIHPATKKPGGPVFDRDDSGVIRRGWKGGDEIFQGGRIGGEQGGEASAGFGRGLEGIQGFGDWDTVDMDRGGFGKVEISDDFEVGLSSKGTKNRAERFVFVIQSDGSPSVVDPDAQPGETEKDYARKEELRASHEGLR
jgi:hypothetical protein